MCFIFTNFFRSTAHNVKLYHSVGNTIAILERIFTVKAASDSIECRNFWSDIIFGLFFHLFSGARRDGEPPSRECWNSGHGGENLSALFLSHIFLHFIVFVILYLSKTIIFSIFFFLASLLRLFFLYHAIFWFSFSSGLLPFYIRQPNGSGEGLLLKHTQTSYSCAYTSDVAALIHLSLLSSRSCYVL